MSDHCKCHTITEDREQIRKHLTQPTGITRAIIPFGIIDCNPIQEAVTRPDNAHKVNARTLRTNNKIHAKIVATKEYVLTGSCNYTQQSIEDRHEIVHVTYRDCCPQHYAQIVGYAEKIFDRSSEVNN